MTSAEAHPSIDVLAELVEGSLDEAVTSASQAHVDQCPTCQGVTEQLRGVSSALQQLPAEVAVPEHVSARLSAALAAEAAGSRTEAAGSRTEAAGTRAEAVAAGAEPASEDTGPVAWFRRRAPQALALAATVAVVGLVGYVVTIDDGSDTSTAGSQGDSGEEAAGSAEAESGPGARAQDEAVPDSADALAQSAPAQLEAQVEQVWESPAELAPNCGEALADELGMDVVGSVESGSGVLIVLSDQEDDQLRGEVVPTCGSTTAESLTSPVVIDIPR